MKLPFRISVTGYLVDSDGTYAFIEDKAKEMMIALNAHDDMKKALEFCLAVLWGSNGDKKGAIKVAERALTKATGESS